MKNVVLMLMLFVPLAASGEDLDCDKVITTIDINRCAAQEFDAVEAEMRLYLDKSLEQHANDEEVVNAINQAQKAWSEYREAHCDAVYTNWRGGTIRGAMRLGCMKGMTQQRTRDLWQDFLVTMEGSSSLPEPER